MRRRGFLLLVPSVCWLSFTLWQAVQWGKELARLRLSDPQMYGMALEARQPDWRAFVQCVAFIGLTVGLIVLVIDLTHWKRLRER
jgi:hypothetical protein